MDMLPAKQRHQLETLKKQLVDLQREIKRLEGPENIIGAKVVYNEKFIKKMSKDDKNWLEKDSNKYPKCGYFIISEAYLEKDGRVIVYFEEGHRNFGICLGNLKMYNQ